MNHGYGSDEECFGVRSPPMEVLREPGNDGRGGVGVCPECERPISFINGGMGRHKSKAQAYDEQTIKRATAMTERESDA